MKQIKWNLQHEIHIFFILVNNSIHPPCMESSLCGKGKGKPRKRLLPSPLRRRMKSLPRHLIIILRWMRRGLRFVDWRFAIYDRQGRPVNANRSEREQTGHDPNRPLTVDDAIETFRKARKIAPHAGVVKSVLRLFDELVKCEGGEILKDVRKAAEGS